VQAPSRRRRGALKQTQANREYAARNNYNNDLCWCNTLLARLLFPDDPAQAARYLQEARAFASHSGVVEHQLRCFQAACELHRHLADYTQAIAEAEAGILFADSCGFGQYSIDLRLALAETYLAAGDARKALQNARNALDRSEHPDCQYAWGQADGLHFCGVAHLRLGERELARQRLIAALELRERLGHGRVEETRRALNQI
jgi:tetratricopeptide (TPR) repeat protein